VRVVANDVSVLKLAAMKGLFAGVGEEQVTYVNATPTWRQTRRRGD